jgi:hypothetical protein
MLKNTRNKEKFFTHYQLSREIFRAKSIYQMQKILSLLMVLWLTGMTCVFCCEPFEITAQDSESCSMASHACCKKKDNSASLGVSTPGQGENVSCCQTSRPKVLTAQNAACSLEKVESVETPELPPRILQNPLPKSYQPFFKPLIADRGGTYIRNCALRI